jgi:Uma2 family endonuclease
VIPEIRSGRHPDVAVVVQGDPRDAKGRLRPSLAVEVVSPGKRSRKRDYEDKRADYLAHDVILEYWIVDPSERRVTVLLRRGAGANARWDERVFRDDEPIAGERLPGLAATPSTLWAGLDP